VRASGLGARAVEADIRDNARQLTLAVQRSFYDVLLADAIRDIVRVRRGIVQQVAAADSARVRAGDLPERALIRTQVELLRTEADFARAGVNAQTSRLVLEGLMGASVGDTSLRVAGDLRYQDVVLPDTGTSLLSRLANRPDITASRTREAQSHEAQQLARSTVFPVPQFSVVRQFTAPFESGSYTSLGISFEVPVMNLYAGQRERASAGVRSAEYLRRRVETQAVREARAALAELSAQRTLVGRYEAGVITKVRENVAATRYAYERGAASLLDVLDALRAQQDVMTDYSTALRDYWVAARAAQAALGIVP
jgi:cobalt-zinc-cadmium efflux system outer membrane protein